MSELADALIARVQALESRLAHLEALEYVAQADLLDGLHAATSGANAHVLATGASGQARVDGAFLQTENCIRDVFYKAVTDGAATAVFTVTTYSGSETKTGFWAIRFHALALSNVGGGQNVSARALSGQFVHVNKIDGTPYTTAVAKTTETASASSWSSGRDITSINVSTEHTSNSVTTVRFTVTVSGSLGDDAPAVLVNVELLWRDYKAAPVLANA